MSKLIDVTKDAFDAEVLKSDVPVFVDFYTTWCGPCKAMAPTLEDLAREYDGRIKIVKIDTDVERDLAQTYEVRGVPTFLVVNKGETTERYSGGLTRGKLAGIFERLLDGAA